MSKKKARRKYSVRNQTYFAKGSKLINDLVVRKIQQNMHVLNVRLPIAL